MSPTALVTGASGFIGGRLVRALVADGWAVRALVRPTSRRGALEAQGVECVVGDLGDQDSLTRAAAGVDVVFHLASLLKVPWKAAFETVNVAGTEAVARACAAGATPPTLVLVSSMAAAGPALDGRGRRETDPPAPVSRYGRVKLAAERAAAAFAGQVPQSVVRPPMVFGPGDLGTLPLFRGAARGWHVVPQRGPMRVGLIHADDLAQALIAVARRGERVAADGPVGAGVYHVSSGEALAYGDLGPLIGAGLGRRVRTVRLPALVTRLAAAISEAIGRLRDRPTVLNLDKYREGTAGDWLCDISKCQQGLGFAPAEPAAARLAETARWYQDEGLIP